MLVYACAVPACVELVFEVLYVEVEFCMLLGVVVHSSNYSYRNSSNYKGGPSLAVKSRGSHLPRT
jgi:hypothetical protein